MKKTFIFFAVILSSLFHTQSFEYERTWATYFGATQGQIAGVHGSRGIVFDSQKNIHLKGNIVYDLSQPASYFNQFVIGGGSLYNQTNTLFSAKFSVNGSLLSYGYHDSSNSTILEKIDQNDNRYYLIFGTSPSVQATAGVYLPTNPNTGTLQKVLLAKYSSTGLLLWATYLPSYTPAVNIELDTSGNVFISGTTKMTQGLGTAGVLQENYDFYYDQGGILLENGYLLKLSSSGQRIWGTYTPAGLAYAMQYYNGSLYMATGININPTLNTMATPAAYQTAIGGNAITSISSLDGTRQWGTYYGPPQNMTTAQIFDIAVNETGLYVAGTDYNENGDSFFGTQNSYKQFVTGGADIFLSKFSLAGSREWSTYFGSSGSDSNEFDNVLALNGGEVYITGNTYGVSSNIATPGSYQDTPFQNTANSVNLYFAKFTSSGNLSWASYYGGTSVFASYLIPINVNFDNNKLYLYGSVNSNTGFTTEGAWMPNRIPNNTNGITCFIARFDNKNLGTTESDVAKDLVLFDNPNSGNFSLQGTVLTKNNCNMTVYDLAGRLITQRKLSNQHKQYFEMQHLLQKGNYMIKVFDGVTTLKTFKMIVK